jgi:hypothetical protein
LVNQQAAAYGRPAQGFINPAIYAIAKGSSYAACFHDVTTGNNINSGSPNLFYAVAGYDLCTGLGTPNGPNLINALAPPEELSSAPVITTQPQNQVINEGGTATFTVAASGTTPLNYFWHRNGGYISGATGATYTLNDVQPSSSGSQFYCVVSNTSGTATSSTATLTVTTNVCVAPPAGIVAWWLAESNAVDSVGGHNGVLENGVGFTSALVGEGFVFNGGTAYVQLPQNLFPFPNATPFSFELWFETTAGGVILGQQNSAPLTTPTGWVPAIYVGTDGKLHVQTFWSGAQNQISSTTAVNNGTYHHVAVTYNGQNEVVYLDGAEVKSIPLSCTSYATTYYYQLGTGYSPNWPDANGGWYTFNGVIDQPTLYSSALTAAQVQSIYNAGNAGKCTGGQPPATTNPCVAPPAGIVAWWQAESNAVDSVGGHNGVLENGVGFTTALVGEGFVFNGSTAYVQLPQNLFPFPNATPFSFESWFETTAGGVILGQQNSAPPTTPTGWVPGIYVGTDGKLHVQTFWSGAQDQISSATAVNNGSYHHVAVTYDGQNEVVYLDGSEVESVALSRTSYATTYYYQLGTGYATSWPDVKSGWYSFNGIIDQPTLYSNALTSAQVQSIYNAGSAGKCTTAPMSTMAALPADQTVDAGASAEFAVTATRLPNGDVQMTTTGLPGTVIQVLGSSDLLNWEPIARLTNFTGTLNFTDPAASNFNCRFYKTVSALNGAIPSGRLPAQVVTHN